MMGNIYSEENRGKFVHYSSYMCNVVCTLKLGAIWFKKVQVWVNELLCEKIYFTPVFIEMGSLNVHPQFSELVHKPPWEFWVSIAAAWMPNSLSLWLYFLAWKTLNALHLLLNCWLISWTHMVLSMWKQEQFEAEVSANDMYLEAKTGQTWSEKQGKLTPLPGIYLLRSRTVFPIQSCNVFGGRTNGTHSPLS